MNPSNVSAPMPQYQSHKKVWALKIKEVSPIVENGVAQEGAMIHPEESGYAPFPVSQEYMLKHQAVVGGYYVVYEDGYKSFSPAEAFESGYTRL